MRILLLTSAPPFPPHSGGALRIYGILSSLAKAGHHLTLLSFADDAALSPALTQYCEAVHLVPPPPPRSALERIRSLLLSGQADLVGRMYSSAMQAKLLELGRQPFDVIQFEGLEMATYLPHIAGKTQARLVYDSFNAEYALQAKIAQVERSQITRLHAAVYSAVQAQRIYTLEHHIGQLADGWIVVSDEDAQLLRPLRGDRPLHLLPSGIFVADYAATAALDLGTAALVFTGKMDYRPNVDAMLWFVAAILPEVRRAHPDVQLYIVGQQPSAAISALAADPNIHVTGRVDDVKPYLRSAAVYIAPLRMGSGTRLKLLEAMASECAVVATDLAAAGLDAQSRASFLIHDAASDFASAVSTLLQTPERRREMGQTAYQAVLNGYDWTALTPRLLAIYKELNIG